MDNLLECNKSITAHNKLLGHLDKKIKKYLAKHKIDLPTVYADPNEGMTEQASTSTRRATTHKMHRCRHHSKRNKGSSGTDMATDIDAIDEPTVQDTEEPTLLQQLQTEKKRMRTFLPVGTKRYLRDGIKGGYLVESQGPSTSAELKVATFNVRGLTREKLDLILQFIDSEQIDVLTCIDAQLTAKSGKYYGKMVKNRLGAGTVTHNSPCLANFGGIAEVKIRRAGGIFIIIGPKWGTSQTQFMTDEFGPKGTGPSNQTAGVLARTTLNTTDGEVSIIASYWPIRHEDHELSDQNLWNCLTNYVKAHNYADDNPTELMGRMIRTWCQTAMKNGSKGVIVTGDFNASWRHNEAGGQFALKDWADEFSFQNGPLRVAETKHLKFYTRGEANQTKSWIDHILHKGSKEFLSIKAAYSCDGTEWEGLSDHRPLIATFKVHKPAQKTTTRMIKEQVRFELDISDKRMCEAFTEGMAATRPHTPTLNTRLPTTRPRPLPNGYPTPYSPSPGRRPGGHCRRSLQPRCPNDAYSRPPPSSYTPGRTGSANTRPHR
jgi:hypothetical protein